MVNKKIKLFIVSIVTVLALFVNVSGNIVSAQTVTTTCTNGAVTSTIRGYLGLNGSQSASVWFNWGPTSALGNTTPHQTFYNDTTFSQALTGLVENRTYFYQAMGSNDFGTETGEIKSFITTCSNPQGEVPTVTIQADDTNIDSGDSTVIRWSSTNATSCTGSGGRNGWAGNRNLSGSFNTRSLNNDTTYSITCRNSNASASDDDSVTVRVQEINRPTVNIYANPSSVAYNGSSTVTWDSLNADSCTASGGVNGWSGSRSRSGTFFTGAMTFSTTFSITCRNSSGSADDSVTVNVGSVVVNNQPTVVISADSTNLAFNGSTNIRWSTTNATSCFASGGSIGWAGVKSIGPGSFFTGSLTSTRTYGITCTNNVGSSSDSVTVNVRGQVLGVTTIKPPLSSFLLVTTSVDRNRPIIPTLDNTNPCPGDEINYSITYQNVGNGTIRNLVLRIDLPLEVDYLQSTPNSPNRGGQSLIFNLGTLGANKEGTVTIRARVRDNVPAGTPLNFPATMTYTDPSGFTQSVNANVSANVCGATSVVNTVSDVNLGASVFGAGFLPTSIFGWLLLLILILILVLLAKYLFSQSFEKRTVTTFQPPFGEKTTTTTIHQ